MPPKSVTCSVCQKLVFKSQTYARKDGSRACRSHSEVASEALELQEKDRQRRWEESQRDRDKKLRFAYSYTGPTQEKLEKLHTHCWVCDQEAVPLREFLFQVQIAMRRLSLRGEFDFFNLPQDVQKLMPGMIPLVELPLKEEVVDRAIIKHLHNRNIREVVPLIRFIRLCAPCVHKHGFGKRLDELIRKPTMDEVLEFMASPGYAAIELLTTAAALKKEQQS